MPTPTSSKQYVVTTGSIAPGDIHTGSFSDTGDAGSVGNPFVMHYQKVIIGTSVLYFGFYGTSGGGTYFIPGDSDGNMTNTFLRIVTKLGLGGTVTLYQGSDYVGATGRHSIWNTGTSKWQSSNPGQQDFIQGILQS